MKKYLAILLSLILVLSLVACGEVEKVTAPTRTREVTENTEYLIDNTENHINNTPGRTTSPPVDSPDSKRISPLLYKVTDDKNNTIWLFGSIHVGKDYFYPLPDYVINAYNSADALAVEADVVAFADDFDAQMDAAMKLMYLDGTSIKDHIPEETYEKAVEVLTDLNQYNMTLDMCMPFMWYSLIENEMTAQAGYDSELGIDMFFLNDAHDSGKEIREVESAEFQYNMMASFSEELQVLLLDDILLSYEDSESYLSDLNELVRFWEQGDEYRFSEYLSQEGEFESEEELRLYEEYNNEMIVKRNLSMTNYAENTLKSGDEVFICVGAAHVVGEGGMADQLAQRGYNVEIVR